MSRPNGQRSRANSSRKMLAFVTKQVTSMIPTILTQINQANQTHGSNDNNNQNANTPKSHFTFKHFNACNPEPFTGEGGASKMLEWFDSIELTFINSDCPTDLRTRSATGVFRSKANVWWTSERTKRGNDAALALPWEEVKQLMTKQFCPAHEIKRLEEEFWVLKQSGGDNTAYTTRFKQLSAVVPHLVNTVERAITKYVDGLPPAIRDAVSASKPVDLEETFTLAAKFTENHVKDGTLTRGDAPKIANQAVIEPSPKPTDTTLATIEPTPKPRGKKRKAQAQNNAIVTPPNPTRRNTQPNQTPQPNYQTHPQPNYQTYPQPNYQTATQPNNFQPNQQPKAYVGNYPKCNHCNYHHPPNNPCRLCTTCNRLGHFAVHCRGGLRPQPNQPQPRYQTQPHQQNQNPPQYQNQRPAANTVRACFKCGQTGHYANTCPTNNNQAQQQPQQQQQQPRGRAFNINANQAQNDNDVVNGI